MDESLDFHSLRHSFVTFGVVAYGFDLAMVYAGHNDLKTQMRYRHIRSRREDAAKMEALMADRGLMTAMPTVPLMPRPAGAEGERNANAKLTETDVEAILRQLHAGVTQRALAAEFGVSSGNLNSIAKGKTWPAVYERVSRELAAAPPDGVEAR